MHLKSTLLLLLLVAQQLVAQGQNPTLSGYIRDAKTGETLIGATVSVKEKPGTGAATNAYGYYALSLPAGTYTFLYAYLGYETAEQKVVLKEAQKLNVS